MVSEFQALQEWQADRFGMYALVPTFILANCLTNAYNRKQMVRQLSEAFDVTDVFMDVRLDMLEQRIRSLQVDRHVADLLAEERQMYDYSYRHPLNHTVEYLVKDQVVIATRRRADI